MALKIEHSKTWNLLSTSRSATETPAIANETSPTVVNVIKKEKGDWEESKAKMRVETPTTTAPASKRPSQLASPQRKVTNKIRKWQHLGIQVSKFSDAAIVLDLEGCPESIAMDWRSIIAVRALRDELHLEVQGIREKKKKEKKYSKMQTDVIFEGGAIVMPEPQPAPVDQASDAVENSGKFLSGENLLAKPKLKKFNKQNLLASVDILKAQNGEASRPSSPVGIFIPVTQQHVPDQPRTRIQPELAPRTHQPTLGISPIRLEVLEKHQHKRNCYLATPVRSEIPRGGGGGGIGMTRFPTTHTNLPGSPSPAYAPASLLASPLSYPLSTALPPSVKLNKRRMSLGRSNKSDLYFSICTGAEVSNVIREESKKQQRQAARVLALSAAVDKSKPDHILKQNHNKHYKQSSNSQKFDDIALRSITSLPISQTHLYKPHNLKPHTFPPLHKLPFDASSNDLIRSSRIHISHFKDCKRDEIMSKYQNLPRDFYEVLMTEKSEMAGHRLKCVHHNFFVIN